MNRFARFAVLAAAAVLAASQAAGEEARILRGVVQDGSGAPVAGAKAKLENAARGEERKTLTDEQGRFELRVPGDWGWRLTVNALGFEEHRQQWKAEELPAEAVQIRLELSELREEVTVQSRMASAPMASENLNVIALGRDLLDGLPMKDGDPLAVPSLFLDAAVTGARGPTIVVDGMETDSGDLPATSIKSVQVNRVPYAAEFGRPGRGRIEMATRRGVHRRYRGGASLLFVNSYLDARNAFAVAKPARQRGVAEVELDGPIGGNVTFLLSGRYDLNNDTSVIHAQMPFGRLSQNVPAPERDTHLFGRLDWRASPVHKLTAFYKYRNDSQRDQGVGGFSLADYGFDLFKHENLLRVLDTATPSATFLNELQFSVKEERQDRSSVAGGMGIIVLDAFRTGGAQVSEQLKERTAGVQDIVTLSRGSHTLRFGASVKPRFYDASDASNFGGTYMFSSIEDYLARRPYLFTRNAGQPLVAYTQHEYYSFVQDEVRLRGDLSVMVGLRHELQSSVKDHSNFAPRFGLAFWPGKKGTVVRAGFGVFYDRQPAVMEQQSLLYDGVRIQQIVIPRPVYPLPEGGGTGQFTTPSVVRIAPDIRLPYLLQGSVSVEQKLGEGQNFLTVECAALRGVHLYRIRNVNAPLDGARPDPGFVNVDQFESTGRSRGYSLTVTVRNQWRKNLDFMWQYMLSRTLDDGSGLFALPANNYDLRGDYGRADFDRRHRFNFAGTYRLPWDLRLGGILNVWSGLPYNITTGHDDNRDTVANDRPVGVGRNTGRGPGYFDVDLRLVKSFRLVKEKSPRMKIGVEAFNLLNRVNDRNYIGTMTSVFFGRANAAYPARQLQTSVRFSF